MLHAGKMVFFPLPAFNTNRASEQIRNKHYLKIKKSVTNTSYCNYKFRSISQHSFSTKLTNIACDQCYFYGFLKKNPVS